MICHHSCAVLLPTLGQASLDHGFLGWSWPIARTWQTYKWTALSHTQKCVLGPPPAALVTIQEIVKCHNIILDDATLFKLMKLLACNVGIIQQTVVFQEHAFKVFEGGWHLLLHLQLVDPMCPIAHHQGNGVLTGLDCRLFISGHIFNTKHYVISFKGGETQTGLLSLTHNIFGLHQLGGNQNCSSGSHDHTHTKSHTGSHKSDID